MKGVEEVVASSAPLHPWVERQVKTKVGISQKKDPNFVRFHQPGSMPLLSLYDEIAIFILSLDLYDFPVIEPLVWLVKYSPCIFYSRWVSDVHAGCLPDQRERTVIVRT